jgi:CRISPR/Cas system-associated endonuclease/helicase Cas3
MLHGEVSDLKSSLAPKLQEFEKYQKEQDEFIKPAENLSKIQRELNRARKEVFEESESFAEAWVQEGGNVSDFCKEFLEKRMLMHQRAAKLERLQQQGSTNNGYAR